ncbi:MAS20 protein import receptor-domain-containing protein [Phycomyces nitens]|nr:MAS20 protein import receptor-domain-containing protein [Phycomyces nitens]
MGMKPQTIALATAGVAATAGIGYLVYFDYKRRNDPSLKKKLRRERKKAAKETKNAEEEAKANAIKLIEDVMAAVDKEVFPESPEEKEKYFMAQVAAGESLCNQGEAFYNDSVLPFYAALKVYPAPLELIMIYQKTIPEPVFQIVVSIMALEQQKRQNGFYEQFPPKDTHVKIGELPAGTSAEGKPIIRRGLVAAEDLEEGQTLYTETPMVSALHPGLERTYCNNCLKKIDPEHRVECTNCDNVAFCSEECEKLATEGYHQFLCTNSKIKNTPEVDQTKETEEEEKTAEEAENTAEEIIAAEAIAEATAALAATSLVSEKESVFLKYAQENSVKYPQMIAQFLSTMIAEEKEKTKAGKASESMYSAWDHIDKYRYLDLSPSEATVAEMKMIKELLGSKVPGIDDFLSEEIYLMLKGKLGYNAYPILAVEGDEVDAEITSKERVRELSSERPAVGAALYKISTYLGQGSDETTNTKLVFGDNHDITVVATRPVKQGEELFAPYVLQKLQ